MFLSRKIIEERPFADVGGFGDVFDFRFLIAVLGKQLQGGAEQALTDARAAPRTAIQGQWLARTALGACG
jgi:hypothetical protein